MNLPVTIHSIAFDGTSVEIVYTETREQQQFVQQVRSIRFDPGRFEELVGAVMEEAHVLLDEVLVALRNPPERFRQGE